MLQRKLIRKTAWAEVNNKLHLLGTTIASATQFVREIERGNLEVTLEEDGNSSELTSSLLSMRDQMKRFSIADQERNWVNEGLARFVEILRSRNNDTLKRLSDSILQSLVTYLKANQGALFLVNDDNPKDAFLEMTACYAYDRKKYLEKRIEIGEGLAGQAVLEKGTVYMTDVPKDFVKITSGLGEALPRNILLVPLKLEDQIFGVVEIASFQVIKPYQIDFVEKLGESIASTIASVRGADRTKKLLHETQVQSEQMRSQEEEMRQSLEELSATQEEMRRVMNEVEANEFYIKNLLNVTSDSIFTIDKEYKLVTWNKSLSQTMERFGIRFEKGMDTLDWYQADERKAQIQFFNRALAGESFEFTAASVLNGVTHHFLSVYAPLRDANGHVNEVAVFAKDVTAMVNAQKKAEQLLQEAQNQAEELKAQEEELRQNMEELSATQDEMQRVLTEVQLQERFVKGILDSSSDMIVTIDRHYKVINCNKALVENYKQFGFTIEKGFEIVNLLKPEERKRHTDVYERAFKGEPVSLHEHYVFEGIEMFIVFSFNPIRNDKNEIVAVAIFAKDVTDITRAKNKIEASEKHIKDLLDVSSDPIMTIDRDYKLVLFNKLYQASFAQQGIHIHEGFDVLSLFSDEKRSAKIETFERVFEGETVEETEHLDQGGLDHYYHSKIAPLYDQSGNINTIAIFAKDITAITKANLQSHQQNEELIQAKVKIEDSERNILELLNVSGESIMTIDRDHKVTRYNKLFRDSLAEKGVIVDAGFDILSIFDPAQRDEKIKTYDRAFKGEAFEEVDYLNVGGFDNYFLVKHAPLFDKDGGINTIAIFAKDITEVTKAKKQAEALLNQSQQYTEELKAQEEELRQNMEEMHAIQEELERKNLEMVKIRSVERERADAVIQSQKKNMQTIMTKFKELESGYKKRIETLERKSKNKKAYSEF